MTLSIATSGVWFFSMLAAVVLGGWPLAWRTDILQLVVPFVLTFAAATQFSLQSSWVGLIVAIAAGWRLIRRGSVAVDRGFAGAFVGFAAALHVGSGVPLALAALLAVATISAGLLLAQGARITVTGAREFGLALVAMATPVIGFAPEVAEGWRSAQLINQATVLSAPELAIPAWATSFIVIALLAGVVRGMWIQK